MIIYIDAYSVFDLNQFTKIYTHNMQSLYKMYKLEVTHTEITPLQGKNASNNHNSTVQDWSEKYNHLRMNITSLIADFCLFLLWQPSNLLELPRNQIS